MVQAAVNGHRSQSARADVSSLRAVWRGRHPNVQKLLPLSIGEDAEEVLKLAYNGEVKVIEQFNSAARESRELGDQGTASVVDSMVLDEEGHADWFESQLQAIKAVGIAGYLAQQVDPASGPE